MPLPLPLPDLDDSVLSLRPLPSRPLPPRAPMPWTQRVRETITTYLPLLLMLLLALGTWWLVKNTPGPAAPAPPPLTRQEPDYTMEGFVIERFDKQGRLELQLRGRQMRHYNDTDIIEVDQPQLRAVADDGRLTIATARRAVANGDGSEVQLIGDARVDSTGPRGEPVQFRGEFLHAFLATERLRSHLPVTVTSGGSEYRAAGMEYDHLSGKLQLQGKMRARLLPSGGPRAPTAAASGAVR